MVESLNDKARVKIYIAIEQCCQRIELSAPEDVYRLSQSIHNLTDSLRNIKDLD